MTSTMNTHLTKKKKVESHEAEGPNEKKPPVEVDVVQSSDIIYLNVGGETMACCRSTLCQVDGSFLASMFSGRWENTQKKDKDGNIFLDFDPGYFKLILKFLRSKKISTPEYPPPAPVPAKDDFPHFYNLVNYLGLRAEFKAKLPHCCEGFEDPDLSNISISRNRKVVKFGSQNQKCIGKGIGMYVTGDSGHEGGCNQWKLEVISWDDPGCIFIGVIEQGDSLVSTTKNILYDEGANGWFGDCIIQNGKSKRNESVVCVGVIHILTLDLDAMTLSLANGRDMVEMKLQQVKNVDESAWWLCVGSHYDTKSEVRLESRLRKCYY